jgi:hypothetical protein
MLRRTILAAVLAGLISTEAHAIRSTGISGGYPLVLEIVDEFPPRPRTIDAESIRIANQLSMELYGGLPGAAKPLNFSRVPAAPNFLPSYPAPNYVPLYLQSIPYR